MNNSFSGKINERCVVVTLGGAERNISEIFIFICEFNERNTIAEFYLKSKAADGGRCTDVYGNIVNTVNGIGNVNRESCILFVSRTHNDKRHTHNDCNYHENCQKLFHV